MDTSSKYSLLESPRWQEYGLLDSGDGLKLERFGSYTLIRPESQAIWRPALAKREWAKAHAIFKPSGEESGGHWDFQRSVESKWQMSYPLKILPNVAGGSTRLLRFQVMTTPGRHLGVFPEAAAHWDFMSEALLRAERPASVLNLFGYTGIASLACAAVGAQVTHVDASRKSVHWARQNQSLSQLEDSPVRWIVDDALKFAQREIRRGARYEGILIEPPKFGRGPKGEVWEVYKSLPQLMRACRDLLGAQPIFVILGLYAVRASAIHLEQLLHEITGDFGGWIERGELVTREQSADRLLSQAVFARWSLK